MAGVILSSTLECLKRMCIDKLYSSIPNIHKEFYFGEILINFEQIIKLTQNCKTTQQSKVD